MSSFVLKVIAALSMLCDHAGLILFSRIGWLRVIGRLAFPLYAFCIFTDKNNHKLSKIL